MEESPQTTKTTKIVTTVRQLQTAVAELQQKGECGYPPQSPAIVENNLIDLSNEITLNDLPKDSHTNIAKSVTITVAPQEEDLRMESADDILARQVQI
jgi:hypothetical protein